MKRGAKHILNTPNEKRRKVDPPLIPLEIWQCIWSELNPLDYSQVAATSKYFYEHRNNLTWLKAYNPFYNPVLSIESMCRDYKENQEAYPELSKDLIWSIMKGNWNEIPSEEKQKILSSANELCFLTAAQNGHSDVVAELASKVLIQTKELAVKKAAENKHFDTVKLLFTNFSYLILKERNDWCRFLGVELLKEATRKGRLDIVECLWPVLKKSGNLDISLNQVLMYAALNGHLDIIKFFLNNEKISEEKKQMVLRYAKIKGHEAIVAEITPLLSESSDDSHANRKRM